MLTVEIGMKENNSKEVRILNGLVKELSPTSTSDTDEYKQFPVIIAKTLTSEQPTFVDC